MHNLIIVDSQPANHPKIRQYIKDSGLELKILATVQTAAEAEAILKSDTVDLIIADDALKGKTGLQLFNENHDAYPNLYMILLADYNRFNNTKELLSGGQIDYLFKPVRKNDVIKSLIQMTHMINEGKKHHSEQVILRENYETSMDVFKDRFLINLIHGHIDSDLQITDQFTYFGISYKTSYVVGVMKIDEYRKYQLVLDEDEKQFLIFKAHHAIHNYLTHKNLGFCFINRFDEICFVITEEDRPEALMDHCYAIQETLHDLLNLRGTIGLGNTYSRPSFISVSYNQARAALGHKFYLGSGSVIHISYVAKESEMAYYYPRSQEQLMIENTVNGDSAMALSILKNLYQALSLVESLSQHYFPLLVIDVLVNINRTASENDVSIEGFFKHYIRLNEINDLKSPTEAYKYLEDAITHICNYQNDHRKIHNNQLLNDIEYYVTTYYANKISLKRAAEYLKTTPFFLEKLIFNKYEQSFYDYCMTIRLDKAKEFLRTTTYSTGEVALKIGFNNTEYFSAIFKQHSHMSPSEFRHQSRFNKHL